MPPATRRRIGLAVVVPKEGGGSAVDALTRNQRGDLLLSKEVAMSTPANDSAQLLAHLFENVQVMMRQITTTQTPGATPDGDPMTAYAAASQQIVTMQQDYWKQV